MTAASTATASTATASTAPAAATAPERRVGETQTRQSPAKTAVKVAIIALTAITAIALVVLAFAFPIIPGVAAAILFTACVLVGMGCLIDVLNPTFPRYHYHTPTVVYDYTLLDTPYSYPVVYTRPIVYTAERPVLIRGGGGHHVAAGRGDIYGSARHVPPVRAAGPGRTVPYRR